MHKHYEVGRRTAPLHAVCLHSAVCRQGSRKGILVPPRFQAARDRVALACSWRVAPVRCGWGAHTESVQPRLGGEGIVVLRVGCTYRECTAQARRRGHCGTLQARACAGSRRCGQAPHFAAGPRPMCLASLSLARCRHPLSGYRRPHRCPWDSD